MVLITIVWIQLKDLARYEQYKLKELIEISEEWKIIRKSYFNDTQLLKVEHSLPIAEDAFEPPSHLSLEIITMVSLITYLKNGTHLLETSLSEESIEALVKSEEDDKILNEN